MQTPLEVYEAELRRLAEGLACADPWFSEQLSRNGDAGAQRAICGSCLGLVLDLAKREWGPDCPLDFLEWVQEGSTALLRFVMRFRGTSAAEFLHQLGGQVRARFTLLRQHPDWARERWA